MEGEEEGEGIAEDGKGGEYRENGGKGEEGHLVRCLSPGAR